MIAALVAGLIRPAVGPDGATLEPPVGLAVCLSLLSLRRAGERAGRMAERLETRGSPMQSIAECWRLRLAGLVVATSWLGLRDGQF